MKRILRTRLALQDLLQVWEYIAEKSNSPQGAGKLLRRIDVVLQHLLNHPQIGERFAKRTDEVRLFPVGDYLIIYRPDADGIQLLRVFHGAQNWEELL